jgi:hypothetical protein
MHTADIPAGCVMNARTAMYETKNEAARAMLVAADIQGWTRAQMKPIVVEANILDIDPDTNFPHRRDAPTVRRYRQMPPVA